MIPGILTPAERRLAALLFTLSVIGVLARGGRHLSPAVEAWLAEVADTSRAAGPGGPAPAPAPGPVPAGASATSSPPGPPPEPAPGIDPNRDGYEALLRLPGVGPVLARRILDDRERNGRYRSPEDLLRVPGIGRRTLERMRPRLALSPPGG